MTILSKSSFSAALLFISRHSAMAHWLRDANTGRLNTCLGNYFIGTSDAIKHLEICTGEFIIEENGKYAEISKEEMMACQGDYKVEANAAVTNLKNCEVGDQDKALDSDPGVICLSNFYLRASNAIKKLETCENDNDADLPIIIGADKNIPAGTCRRTFHGSMASANNMLKNCNGSSQPKKEDSDCRRAYYRGVDKAKQLSDNLPDYFINVSNAVKTLEKCEKDFFLPVPFDKNKKNPLACEEGQEEKECKADCGVGSMCKKHVCHVHQGEVCKTSERA